MIQVYAVLVTMLIAWQCSFWRQWQWICSISRSPTCSFVSIYLRIPRLLCGSGSTVRRRRRYRRSSKLLWFVHKHCRRLGKEHVGCCCLEANNFSRLHVSNNHSSHLQHCGTIPNSQASWQRYLNHLRYAGIHNHILRCICHQLPSSYTDHVVGGSIVDCLYPGSNSNCDNYTFRYCVSLPCYCLSNDLLILPFSPCETANTASLSSFMSTYSETATIPAPVITGTGYSIPTSSVVKNGTYSTAAPAPTSITANSGSMTGPSVVVGLAAAAFFALLL